MKESVMENMPLFASLSAKQRALVAKRMVLETRRPGESVFVAGQPAKALYVIKSGWVRLLTEQYAVLANLSSGNLVGDADAFQGRTYTTTAEAATDVALWALSAKDLAEMVAADPEIGQKFRVFYGITEDQVLVRHLRRLGLLAGLTQEQVEEVARRLRPEHFKAGQMICRQGMPGDALYLIDEGQVAAQIRQPDGAERTLLTLGHGDFFGETAILTGEPNNTNMVALSDVTGWTLAKDDFESLVMRFPSLALNLSRALSRRLRQSNDQQITSVRVMPAPPATGLGPAEAAVTGSVMGLSRAANSTTGWFASRSTGAKLRLIAIILLLIWLLGIAAPAAVIQLLSSTNTGSVSNAAASAVFSQRIVRVAMAADLPVQATVTYTPWPTETPIPTATFTPTATPTNTPTATPTFTPSPTPIPPTATPVPPTPTPRPVVQEAPVVAMAAAAAAPAPSTQYTLVESRRMTPCENRGKHNIYIKVVDAAGNPVDGVTLVQSPADQPGRALDKMVTGEKGPGLAEFVMWKKAEYAVYISDDGANPANSDIARPLHANYIDEAACSEGGGGNTLYHNSFNVVFQKNF